MSSNLRQPRHLCGESVFGMPYRDTLVHDPPEVILDGTVPFTVGGSVNVPEEPGIYLIHDLRGVLYVGQTRNLYHRYFQHFWDSHNRRVTAALRHPTGRLEFSWLSIDVPDQDHIERELIRAFQPLCNCLLYKTN